MVIQQFSLRCEGDGHTKKLSRIKDATCGASQGIIVYNGMEWCLIWGRA